MNLGHIISSQISLIAQHDSSRLGFPALITALCKTRGVTSDSLTFESLSLTINVAYVKKNCWNLDDSTVTFRGPCRTKGKRSEALPSSEVPPTTSTPSTTAPASFTSATYAPSPAQLPVLAPSSSRPSDFYFTLEMLFAML